MEMNTRLQVEHPVTEEITGQDLVEWQLRVASGEKLPLRQEQLAITGWAMEARLYAEDPAHEFLPSTGRLEHFELGRHIRVDTGVEEGDRISPYYDPMIAKLIASGASRGEAIDRLLDTLDQVEVWPVKTNAAFLARAAADPDFRAGEVDTSFIPSKIDSLVPDPAPPDAVWNLAANAMLAADFETAGGSGFDPWRALQGFRANSEPDLRVALRHGAETRMVDLGEDERIEGVATPSGDAMLVFSEGQAFAFALPGAAGGAGGRGFGRRFAVAHARPRDLGGRAARGQCYEGTEADHARGDEDGAQSGGAVRRARRGAQRGRGGAGDRRDIARADREGEEGSDR